jgi:hypothetical protein
VTYKNGVATLAGTVTDTDQRDTAIRLAKQVKGVKKVECKLEFPAVAKIEEASEPVARAEEPSAEGKNENSENADASTAELGYVGGPAVTPQQRQQVRQASAQQQQQLQQAPYARNGFNRQMQQRPRMMPRRSHNNMPLPQRRMQDPSIRQTSGVYQAGWRASSASGIRTARWCSRPELRESPDAGLRLAELCLVSELRGAELSTAIFADGLAVHRSVLSVSASAAGMAEGVAGMG